LNGGSVFFVVALGHSPFDEDAKPATYYIGFFSLTLACIMQHFRSQKLRKQTADFGLA
jgi:hypothetical protein